MRKIFRGVLLFLFVSWGAKDLEAKALQKSPQESWQGSAEEKPPSKKRRHPLFENTSTVTSTPYEVVFEGDILPPFLKDLASRLDLMRKKNQGVASLEQAQEHTQKNQLKIKEECAKAGYFDADIVCLVRSAPKLTLVFQIHLGAPYTLKNIKLEGQNAEAYEPFLTPYLRKGDVFDSSKIFLVKAFLAKKMKQKGFFFAQFSAPILDIDRITKTVDVTYPFVSGGLVSVESISVEGLKDVPKKFVVNRLAFSEGKMLTRNKINHSQLDLLETGLFAEVKISATPSEEMSGKGEKKEANAAALPVLASQAAPSEKTPAHVNVAIVEAPPRMIGLGAYWAGTEGFLVSGTWTHKNFLKKACNVGGLVRAGLKELSATGFLDIPDVFRRNQKVHLETSLKHLNTKAYEGNKISAQAGVLQNGYIKDQKVSFSFLPTWEHSKLDRKKTHTQTLFGIEMEGTFHKANHRVYPTSGMIITLEISPYFGGFPKIEEIVEKKTEAPQAAEGAVAPGQNAAATPVAATAPSAASTAVATVSPSAPSSATTVPSDTSKKHMMTRFIGTFRGYIPLKKNIENAANSTVLSFFASAGITAVGDADFIPLDKRFYGGGRNSIRSYGYQLCGDLDEDGTPVGGASFVEACFEPRLRISKDVGLVAFLEMSSVSRKKTPNFSGKVLWGGGLGIRYFTRFGPIRFDVGIPFQRREDKDGKKVDRLFQFYISVGQSF